MTLALTQSLSAVAPGRLVSFRGVGGTEPYVYSVVPGGAGGSIDASSGIYTAPAAASSAAGRTGDTVRVTDAGAATATARVLVALPLLLFCDLLRVELELAEGRVFLWNQKIMAPTDDGLYVAVSVSSAKAFASVNRFQPTDGGATAEQYVVMTAAVDVDVISKGPDARDRKEEVLLALASQYASLQMTANGFSVSRLGGGRITDLSAVDGAAIPYRFRIPVIMQYAFSKSKAAPYFDTFAREVFADDGTVVDMATLISGNGVSPATDLITGGDAGTTLEP